jgi:predicted O-methyltransferase YrrM
MAMTCRKVAEKACKEWFAYQNPLELEMALRAVEIKQPKIIVEIGIAHGASLAAWAEISNPDLVVSIDPLDLEKTPDQQVSLNGLVKKYNFKLIKHFSQSEEAHKELKEMLGERKIDFLFIDGHHGYDPVRADFYQYLPYMNESSIVGFHDIYYSDQLFDSGAQVSFLWQRIKRTYPSYDEFYFHSSMGIGLLYL